MEEFRALCRLLGRADIIFFDLMREHGLKERHAVDPRIFLCFHETGGDHDYEDGTCRICKKEE